MGADGHHRGGDGRRQHQGRDHQQQPDDAAHPAAGRIDEQDRADRGQREHAGGVPAGQGLAHTASDHGLEHVLGEADGGGDRDGGQDGSGPPAGRHAGKDQRRGDERERDQRAETGQPGQEQGEMAQPGADPRVDGRIEPSWLGLPGEVHRQRRR
jgi:hypothetical protein